MKSNVVVPTGGVSFESARNRYRGSITVNGVRHRTGYRKTLTAARLELSALRSRLLGRLLGGRLVAAGKSKPAGGSVAAGALKSKRSRS